MKQIRINLENTCYYSLPRLKSIDLLNPTTQRALQKVINPEIVKPMLLKKKKKNWKLKNHEQEENNRQEYNFSQPQLSQQIQMADNPNESKFPKLKIQIIPAREENNSKLKFEKFTFRDPNTPRRMDTLLKKKYLDSQLNQQKVHLTSNKSTLNALQHSHVEQLKNAQSSIIYYLSQQNNQLDHHFDLLENQLSF